MQAQPLKTLKRQCARLPALTASITTDLHVAATSSSCVCAALAKYQGRGHTGVHSATQTQGCLRHTGRMPLLIWWNSTSCRRSMKSVRPSSMVKYFLPPSSHCRHERQSQSVRVYHKHAALLTTRQTVKGTHRDHQVVFSLQLVAQREDEALRVLLALSDQEHAATQIIQTSASCLEC